MTSPPTATELELELVRSSPLPIVGFLPEGRIQLWNRGAEQLFGLTLAQVYGKAVSDLLPESVRPTFLELAKEASETGLPRSLDFEYTDRLDQKHSLQVTVFRVRSSGARGPAQAAVFTDIRPILQKTAGSQQRVEELEQRLTEWIAYTEILEPSIIHVALSDVLQGINTRIERTLACDLSALFLRQTDGTLTARTGTNISAQALRSLRAIPDGSVLGEVMARGEPCVLAGDQIGPPLSSLRLEAVAVFPMSARNMITGAWIYGFKGPHLFTPEEIRFLSRIAGHIGATVERAQLYEEVAGLSVLTAINPNIIIRMDREGKILYTNPAAKKLVSSLGEGKDIQSLLPSGFLQDVRSIAGSNDVLTGRESKIGDSVYRFIYKALGDGESVFISGEDVSKQKAIDQMKNDFVSMVSHELRTPLTAIKGYVDLMLGGDTGALNPGTREYLEIVANNSVRLLRLINELLDIDRIESGLVELKREPVDLAKVVKRSVAFHQVSIDKKGLSMKTNIQSVPEVVGDADALGQVVSNLIDNAIKYTPQGVVEVSLGLQDSSILLSVKDSGIGISPQDLPRLFTKFFRSSSAETRSVPGTGLGLSIVKAIVERHKGQIRVQSEPGKGTEFLVSLPPKG
jgi:PAS domain S-box-containing protein